MTGLARKTKGVTRRKASLHHGGPQAQMPVAPLHSPTISGDRQCGQQRPRMVANQPYERCTELEEVLSNRDGEITHGCSDR
jgi:hypothetical protein